jgi:hypothetical protein
VRGRRNRRQNIDCQRWQLKGAIEAYSDGFCGSATSGRSMPRERLLRASAKRSRSWTMRPRCFFSAATAGLRRTGGEIFSNVKDGTVFPLVVELRHLGVSLHYLFMSLTAL